MARVWGTEAVILSTMAFGKAKDGYRTMMGVSLQQGVEAMTRAGADILGCNLETELSMEDHAEVVRQFRAYSQEPLIVQPNASRPELVGTQIVYKHTPEAMAAKMMHLVKGSANIIGGCCGTTLEYIRLFSKTLKEKS